jgi:Uncharacterised protein family (UPF0158)
VTSSEHGGPVRDALDVDSGLRALVGATLDWDGAAVVALLTGRPPGALLQHAGDGLLVALAQRAEGAAELVPDLVEALTLRGDRGDAELAEHLTAATAGPATGRRPVPAELDRVTDLLEGDLMSGYGGYLDLSTGDAWSESAVEDGVLDEEVDLEDDERWLRVPHEGSREAWRDMRDFADSCSDPALAERLLDAIEGRGAFSRFRRVLDRAPEWLPDWYAYRDERHLGRARAWLADTGFDAVPPPPFSRR